MTLSVTVGLAYKYSGENESSPPDNDFRIAVLVSDPSAEVTLALQDDGNARALHSWNMTDGEGAESPNPPSNLPGTIHIGLTIVPKSSNENVKWIIFISDANAEFYSGYGNNIAGVIEKEVPIYGQHDLTNPPSESQMAIEGDSDMLAAAPPPDDISAIRQTNHPIIATFGISQFDVANSVGYAARLPCIATFEPPPFEHPIYLAAQSPSDVEPYALVDGRSYSDDDQGQPILKIPVPGTTLTPYFNPDHLNSVHVLSGASDQMRLARYTNIVPSDGQVRDDDVVWKAEGSLCPVLQTTTAAYLDERSTSDFYAGIAFATAAAAFIAAVQEIRSREPESAGDQIETTEAPTKKAQPTKRTGLRPRPRRTLPRRRRLRS